ncbi:hypothetical protein QZH41_016872 [Actinostola sp. cb2023]|nr:hypothetical protein QZH41_016872 [Actinostola sp. cb2023]
MADRTPEALPSFPHFGTIAIHEGQEPELWNSRAVVPPISLATTFKQDSPGQHRGFEYSRSGNPTRQCFEKCVAGLEGAKYAFATASGLSASMVIAHLMKSGDHIACVDDVYGGTNRYFSKVMASAMGIEVTLGDFTDSENVKKAIKPNTKIVWVETPTNPLLKLIDIKAVADIVHQHEGVILVVDNTFSSSYFQRPLSLGADVVMHSVTKYMNAVGSVPSPFDCYLANRGLKTLHLRMRQHAANAFAVAKFLEKDERCEKVLYPGLEAHPQHELAKRQMTGFGGMVTFYIKDGLEQAKEFLKKVKASTIYLVFTLAESLGGFESLCELPSIMTHASVPPDQRIVLGISDNMLKEQRGIENRVQVNRAVEGQVVAKCLQVYNEKITDLLSPIHEGRKLDLTEDPVVGVDVKNITKKQVSDAAECTALFRQALESTTHSKTDYGQADTRSAMLFILDLIKVHKDTPEPFHSRLMVVKLPGAEKLAEDPTQLRMREGPTLNRSILAFRQVVSSLAASPMVTRVINYNDSKLTMLLKDALGGNCKTKVLVTLKATETATLSTVLTMSGQLAQILNYPIVNDHLAQNLISQYRAIIFHLQDDLRHSGRNPGDARDSKVQEMKDQLAKITNENAKLQEGREQLYRRIIELEAKYTEATTSWKQLSSKLELSDEEKLQIYKNLVDLQLENNKLIEEAAADKYELTNRILSLENEVSELDTVLERDRRAGEQANIALDELQREHKELGDEYLVLKTNHMQISNQHQQEVVSKNEELGLELVHLSSIKDRLKKDKESVEIETMQVIKLASFVGNSILLNITANYANWPASSLVALYKKRCHDYRSSLSLSFL